MARNGGDPLPAVNGAEAALHGLGAARAGLDQRPAGRGHWFADWSGRLAGSDVYIAVMGKSVSARKVRLVLDDWILEDVAVQHVGDVLTAVFSAAPGPDGGAEIRRGRALLVLPVLVLRVRAGRARYSATKRLPEEGAAPPSPWERALTADE
ncbi:hypothetical protein [Streptomyces montanisoli]|uniref:Uncharacterized protein n=1 Tax=Streptomyces montanisoli TaxID=2798581 RepID=A0A940MKF6_9ACTN|nr:hypothetical protein [Streptomyces montanisoli]MBP0461412.1 hypothetical protein [Streptomyces montanisoli]